MLLREMKEADIDQVMAIEQEIFSSPWRKEDYLYELADNPYASYYVIEDEDIIAYAGLWISYETSQVTTIGVRADRQGEGLGRMMLAHLLKKADEAFCENCTLEVRVSNARAIHLYESLGFKKTARRENYYLNNHEDAYLMIKERVSKGNEYNLSD